MIFKLLLNLALPRILLHCCQIINLAINTSLKVIFPVKRLEPFPHHIRVFLIEFYLFGQQCKILINLRLILFDDDLFHVPTRVEPV
jgi:hypothetical protein